MAPTANLHGAVRGSEAAGLNLITVGDYFHLKYGSLGRELAVINCMIFLVGVLAAQLAAIGTVTNSVLGIPYGTGLLIGAAVTIFYATVGGIRAIVNTDVLQFVILVVGIGVASATLVAQHGGLEAMLAAAGSGQADVTGRWTTTKLLSLFFAFLLGESFAPTYAVRCFIARDREQARWGVAGAGIFLILFLPIATFILGTSAQIHPDVQTAVSAEQGQILESAAAMGQEMSQETALDRAHQVVFPALVRSTFHPALAGIMIAAIVAAVMSSADSCLSCFATVIMEDTYRRHINKKASDQQLLRIAQVTTLVAGVTATACAWFFSNVADILVFVYDLWAPAMILPFLVGVFWYSPTRSRAVVVSMVVGSLATVAWRFGLGSPGDVGPALFGVSAALVAFVVALPLTERLPASGLFKPNDQEAPR